MISNTPEGKHINDTDLLALFGRDFHAAWTAFIEKYSDHVFTQLRRMGFDHDESMERFVYVMEKLSEDDCRRLKAIKTTEPTGNLKAWLNTVIRNFSINWAWSENGRKRLLGYVAELSERDQRIFQLFFWQGKTPFEIFEILRLEHDVHVDISDVFEGLERVAGSLSHKKRWRLMSNLNRGRKELSFEIDTGDGETAFEPEDTSAVNAEQAVLAKEDSMKLSVAFEELSVREQLVIRFRYEEDLTLREVAEALGWDQREAVNIHKSAIYKFRKALPVG